MGAVEGAGRELDAVAELREATGAGVEGGRARGVAGVYLVALAVATLVGLGVTAGLAVGLGGGPAGLVPALVCVSVVSSWTVVPVALVWVGVVGREGWGLVVFGVTAARTLTGVVGLAAVTQWLGLERVEARAGAMGIVGGVMVLLMGDVGVVAWAQRAGEGLRALVGGKPREEA